MKKSESTPRILLSPACYWAHFIVIPVIEVIAVLLVCLEFAIFHSCDALTTLTAVGLLHLGYVPAIPFFFLIKTGFIAVYFDQNKIQSKKFKKELCQFSWQEINYIAFTKSYNYSNDTKPIYVVLAKEYFTQLRHSALSFNRNKQIVVRMTPKNFTFVMSYLQKTGIFMDDIQALDFKQLNQLALLQPLQFSRFDQN